VDILSKQLGGQKFKALHEGAFYLDIFLLSHLIPFLGNKSHSKIHYQSTD